VVNRVLSRAQKGFTKTRQIHEVIINLSETINFCEKNNIKGAMICVDQAKAFDSVDHQYMKKVFTFFGFGERFITWLTTIGTNRKACVILENGKTSNIFDLLKGTAQGDCPSPIIYNICAQILIFKIELDSSIRRIDTFNGDVPVPLPVPVLANAHILRMERDGDFLHESAMETSKNESFADDSTTCTYLDFNDIYSLKQILSDFADLSGLKCNFDKTSIMRIGNLEGEIDQRILDMGFKVVESCTLLGFKFSNRIGLALSNEKDLINKISNSLRFWTPFNLSLAGKITVAKSLILPLFIYYATVINFSNATIETIEKKIETFVCGGLNISNEKIYATVTDGGINLFKLHDFALALQCSWV
jgi:hypothetical protein